MIFSFPYFLQNCIESTCCFSTCTLATKLVQFSYGIFHVLFCLTPITVFLVSILLPISFDLFLPVVLSDFSAVVFLGSFHFVEFLRILSTLVVSIVIVVFVIFFIYPSIIISHSAFSFLFRFIREMCILSQATFTPAQINSVCSVMSSVGIYFNNSFSFSVSDSLDFSHF